MSTCSGIPTIISLENTSWFDSILMCTLYSQHARNIIKTSFKRVLKDNKTRSLSDDDDLKGDIFEIFNNLLFRKTGQAEYFKAFNSRVILDKLYRLDPDMFFFDPKKNTSGYFGHSNVYCYKILNLLGVTNLDCFYLDDNKLFYANDKNIFESKLGLIRFPKVKTNFSPEPNFGFANDVIIIHKLENVIGKSKVNSGRRVETPVEKFTLEEVIIIQGEVYVLDSMILCNYDVIKKMTIQVIAGITCNSKRYIYNGSTSCKLIEADWWNTKTDFCVNPKLCGITNPTNKDFCFNTMKGNKTYIYVNRKYTIDRIESPMISPLITAKYDIASIFIYGFNLCKSNDHLDIEDTISIKDRIREISFCNYATLGMLGTIVHRTLKQTDHGSPLNESGFEESVIQAVKQQNVLGKNIILYGFSYGGGVVSRIAKILKKGHFPKHAIVFRTFGSIYVPPDLNTDGYDVKHYMFKNDIALKVNKLVYNDRGNNLHNNVEWLDPPRDQNGKLKFGMEAHNSYNIQGLWKKALLDLKLKTKTIL